MRFPAGLKARLLKRRLLHAFRRNGSSPIFQLSPMVEHFPSGVVPANALPDSEWQSPRAGAEAAQQAGATVVWLGGTEPLFHPSIGEVSSALVDAGYYVFLHTSGVALRQRIHEFKPVGRLYLTLEVPTNDAPDAQRGHATIQNATFPTLLEAFRVARLSGFHLCAHFTATEATSSASVAARLASIRPYLDGIAVSSFGASAANSSSVADSLAAISQLIPSAGWRSFSRLLEASPQPSPESSAAAFSPPSGQDQRGPQSACEESA